MRRSFAIRVSCSLLGATLAWCCWDMPLSSAQDFERDVLPIFRANCLACHNASERQGDLVLETPATILSGGDTGPGVVPGQPEASLLWQLAAHREEPVMPPEDNDVGARRLNDAELAVLAGWMTVGYVAHSYDVDRLRLAEALGLDPSQRLRLTLDEIAARSGMPLAEVEATLLAVIAAERAGQAEEPVVPDRP